MHPLKQLQFSKPVAKRAQYEAFTMDLVPEGVRVRNESHEDPADHEYRVTVTDGLPVACTCPADEHYEGACKHRVAVAVREPVLEAATTQQATAGSLAPDGGTQTDRTLPVFEPTSDGADGCEDCTETFPCWECVRTGRRPMLD